MPSPGNRGDDRRLLLAVTGARIEPASSSGGPAASLRARKAAVIAERAGQKGQGMPHAKQDLVAALERVAAGDRAAFERLYGGTSLKLYGILARILGRRDLADDVLQDVYVRVWQRAGDFDPASGSPIAWLAPTARNLALDEARRGAAGSLEDFPHPLRQPSGEGGSAAQERNEELCRLNQWLNGLAPERREMVLLAYHWGMTREQISSHVDRPVATVKTWLRRSLAQLKECLGQ